MFTERAAAPAIKFLERGKHMNSRNRRILLIACAAALLLSAALLLGAGRGRTPVTEDTAIITVNGREYTRVPLSAPRTVTVSQTDGSVNVIEVTAEGAVMLSSTCENQLCVHMGQVTRDNWEFRPNGAFIICLPNRVSVELAVVE